MDQQPRAPLVLSVEDAIAMAIELHQAAQLTEADVLYRKILAVAPDHPVALQFAGILAHQQERDDEAVALLERSLHFQPGRADCYNNLGIVLNAQGRLDDALAAYRRAIELDPSHADAHNNLGVLLRAQEKPAEAEAAFRAAIRLDPEQNSAYHNLGLLLARQGRGEEAVACFSKAVALSPKNPATRRVLADQYRTLGRPEKAIEIYQRWLEEEPGDPVAEHLLAACSGRALPARGSDAYIEATFDEFASTFEARLLRLAYRAPAVVAAMLADAGVVPEKALDVLDAGCGTGLCAPFLAPYARRLTGVDLSAGMLAWAAEKKVYDDLIKGELTAYLWEHPASFDVIVSADTLCYFGRLEEFATAACGAIRTGGLVVFTVEEWVNADPGGEFLLRPHGRYAHARAYVERTLTEAGLEPGFARVELRMESGKPVAGLAVRASKATTSAV